MRIRLALGAAFAALAALSPGQNLFDGEARHNVKKAYQDLVQMNVGIPPTGNRHGAWQVRQTAEGSKWMYDFQKSQPPEEHSDWWTWIDAKRSYDQATAAKKAARLN